MNFWWHSHSTWLAWLLWPLSLVYRFILLIRNFFYSIGLFKTVHFSIPVIVIGNLTVGGSGKTPFVIALAKACLERGLRPGIVSRGYGGKAPYYPFAVDVKSDPKYVGDEPLLIAQKTRCPLFIDPNRPAAVEALLGDCDLILSDDGLQHLPLGRDKEIILIDAKRRFGNGFLLPAGPLRTPLAYLQKSDWQIEKNGAADFSMQMTMGPYYQLLNPENRCETFENKKIWAYAGIADPTQFFQMLTKRALVFQACPRPDHAVYKKSDFSDEAEIIVMTEKDAVKCLDFADHRFWVVPIEAQISEKFLNIFFNYIKQKTPSKNPSKIAQDHFK